MYGYPDPEKPMQSPDLWLCKPDLNRTATHKLKDVYNISYINKFSAINELSFTIPAIIERNHELIQNPLVGKIKERFLVKMKNDNGEIEFFIILKTNKKLDGDGFESITYQAYSQGIQLTTKLIRDYEETSKNLTYLARDMLAQTTWKLDYVDVDFDLKYRSFEVSSSNALQCIFDLATKFNAGIVFNTLLKTISFHKPQNIGRNKGLSLKAGKYLESFDLAIKQDEMITRLKAYGQDGLEFRRLSPTGSNYIEDFSYFMFPFECDANYNVIKKSRYMTDALCIAITKYQKKLASIQGQFDSLTAQATTQRDSIQKREQELSVLTAQKNDILNRRDVINYTYGEKAPERQDWKDVINELNNKLAEITAKETQIAGLNTQLDTIQAQINSLREQVKVENNFTQDEIKEREYYIIEKEYYNDSITNEEDLLKETLEVFDELRQPPIDLTMSMDNFLSSFEPNFDRNKLSNGDTLKLKSKNLNTDVTAKITEFAFNYDSGDVSVTVSNTQRDNDDFSKFIEKLNLATNTSTTVNIDKYKWKEGSEAKSELEDYINSNLDSAKQLITGGMNNSVTLNERGLIAVDMLDKNSWLMIQNGQLFITPDNGNTVSVAINKNGVFAERLFGKIVLSNKLYIEDTDGVVTIQNALMTVYDLTDKARVHLGRYPNPDNTSQFKYGLRVYDGAIDIRTSENANRGTQIDGKGIRTFNNNGVRTFNVDAATGMVEIVGSLSIRTSLNSNQGVVIDGDGIRGYNSSGQIKFQISTSTGDAMFGGRLNYATGNIDNVGGTFTGNLVASGGTFTGTLNGVDGVFTGSLQAATGTFNGLVTGSLSADTVRAIRIDADQINALRVTADMIQVNDLSAISANMGTITSGNINIDENMFIGRELTIGRSYTDTSPKRINFGNNTGGYIQHQNDVLKLGALDGVSIDILRVNARLDVTGAQLIGFPK